MEGLEHVQRREMGLEEGVENESLWVTAERAGSVYSGAKETQGWLAAPLSTTIWKEVVEISESVSSPK